SLSIPPSLLSSLSLLPVPLSLSSLPPLQLHHSHSPAPRPHPLLQPCLHQHPPPHPPPPQTHRRFTFLPHPPQPLVRQLRIQRRKRASALQDPQHRSRQQYTILHQHPHHASPSHSLLLQPPADPARLPFQFPVADLQLAFPQ